MRKAKKQVLSVGRMSVASQKVCRRNVPFAATINGSDATADRSDVTSVQVIRRAKPEVNQSSLLTMLRREEQLETLQRTISL